MTMMRKLVHTAMALLRAGPAQAQSTDNPLAAALSRQFTGVARNVVAAAEAVPESLYDYRPTPDVRSMGELFGQVTDYFYQTCAGAAGEEMPDSRNFEALATKAAHVAAITAARDYCTRVWADATDTWLLEVTDTMMGRQPRVGLLTFNNSHTNEHYGNLVTYMRLNDIVPPSSQ
jgi:uncharacterized damage-inducible protein DinB